MYRFGYGGEYPSDSSSATTSLCQLGKYKNSNVETLVCPRHQRCLLIPEQYIYWASVSECVQRQPHKLLCQSHNILGAHLWLHPQQPLVYNDTHFLKKTFVACLYR